MSFDEEHRDEHELCALEIDHLKDRLRKDLNDYHALALELGRIRRRLDWYEGGYSRQEELRRQRKNKMLSSYRRRVARLQSLVRERKSFTGWLRAKWRRLMAR